MLSQVRNREAKAGLQHVTGPSRGQRELRAELLELDEQWDEAAEVLQTLGQACEGRLARARYCQLPQPTPF